ncbi:histidine kinase dimerization/phosphoacceptor domain -containing protein [Pedobacter sp. GSP4]|uniref:histidine kinase dimerization/phosphoacceptor domain -containing protein n=1 Tax=Pedobacter sp. GSP4 TaxID=3453716 RepID=UPI003EEAFEBC
MLRLLYTVTGLLFSLGLCAQQKTAPDAAAKANTETRTKNRAMLYAPEIGTGVGLAISPRYYSAFDKLFSTPSDLALKEKIAALENAGRWDLTHGQKQLGVEYFKQAIALQRAANNSEGEINSIIAFAGTLKQNFPQHRGEAQPFIIRALKIAKQLRPLEAQIRYRYLIAETNHYLSYLSDGEADCQEVVQKFGNTKALFLADCYYLIAKTHRYWGNLNKSLYYGLESIKAIQPATDTLHRSKYLGEMGQIYQELGQREKSIAYYRETIQLREHLNIPLKHIFVTAGFIVQQLIELQKPKEALKEIIRLEKRHPDRTASDNATIAQIKANCYVALGNSAMAERYFLKMLGLFTEQDEPEAVSNAKYDFMKFYVATKQFAKAEPILKQLTSDYTLGRKKDIYFMQFKIDSAKGQYNSAIQKLNNYIALKDSIFNQSKSKQIQELQVKYEMQQSSQAIRLLKQANIIQLSKVKEATFIRNITFLGIIVLILFLVLLYYNYRQKQINNVKIQSKNIHLNELLNEKEWLIKEVHHRVKNNLQIVMGLLQSQSSYIDNEKAYTAIKNSEHRMHSIALIHQKLYQNDNISQINMSDYINELISYLKDSYDIGPQINFNKDIDNCELDVSLAVPLGLILNEAITNTFKYAFDEGQCGDVYIALKKEDDKHLSLMIKDDGKGFSSGIDLDKINSLGLNLMKGLSKQIGASFSIQSAHGVEVNLLHFKKTYTSH